MKKLLFGILPFILLIAACATTSTAVAPAPAVAPEPGVSGLNELRRAIREVSGYLNSTIPAGNMIVFVNVQAVSEELSDFIIDNLIANAVNDRVFTVVDRQRLDLIREEQGFQLSGEVDDETSLSIGRFFGAQTIVSGRVSSFGGHFHLTVRALDVQTAQVQGQYIQDIGTERTITALMGTGGAPVAQAPGRQPGRTTVQVPTQAAAQPPAQLAALAPPQPPTPPARPEVVVEGGSLVERLQWLEANAANNTLYHIEITANETIAPQTLSFARARNVTVRLSGAAGEEWFISLSGNGTLFTIEPGVTLILDNGITLEGHNGNNAPLVVVNARGELVMNDGAKIVGNNNTDWRRLSARGGGVQVNEQGIFNMNGGEISGNSLSSQTAEGGGGVFLSRNGRFTMTGGVISDNSSPSGGGVRIEGIFAMSGGAISDNRTIWNSADGGAGGGVAIRNGSFTMTGGSIYGNTTGSTGGGVAMRDGTFTMSGGVISANVANRVGGGLNINNGTFTKTGGTIYGSDGGNNANRAGRSHAVHAQIASLSPLVRNNTAGPSVRMDTRTRNATGGWEG